jgi:PadR family transcriptional regulator, regulatory protein AphA
MELGKTAYVILGMLRMGKRTGYDIKSLVDVSTRFFWAASYGQIYPELKRLEEAGLIAGEAEATGGRRRRAYSLTKKGEAALRGWLTSGGPLHIELRHEGVLRLFFSDELSKRERRALVRAVRAEHERLRDELAAIRPAASDTTAGAPLEVLEFGIAYQDFVIDWCSRLEHS